MEETAEQTAERTSTWLASDGQAGHLALAPPTSSRVLAVTLRRPAVGVIGSRETDAVPRIVSEFVHGDRLRRPPVVRPRLQPGPMEKERLVCLAAQ